VDEIRSRLIGCFTAALPQVPEDRITTVSQDSTEGWDSVTTATLFALIEEEFEISLDSADLENLESFSRAYGFLQGRLIT
jgi:acyl carrier protein